MNVYVYDGTFEGLLSAVFEAYERRVFPDVLQAEGEMLPLFYDQLVTVSTDSTRAERVWRALQKKLSRAALGIVLSVWQSELPEAPALLFRYIRKAVDAPRSPELDFGDDDVLRAAQIARRVAAERERVIQFVRFRKAADGTYFALIEPKYNVLASAVSYFRDRFADQLWLIYDCRRRFGYYYDLQDVREVAFSEEDALRFSGKAADGLLAADERLFQQLWQTYFHFISIRERANPRLHRKELPVRFWKYLTEKQGKQ